MTSFWKDIFLIIFKCLLLLIIFDIVLKTCHLEREPCIPNPCQHHGTCKSLNETAKCSCRGMWLQPLCKGITLFYEAV